MNKKTILKGLFAAILSLSCAAIFGGSASYAEAVITRGLFTGEGDVRWEWQKAIDAENEAEPEMVSIMFYDKPAAATTIVVPSLSDVITAASATSTLDTYYVRNADQTSQDAYFTTETRRDFGSHVTKLDMTNTSKVQIMGVKPILNPETEAELVFGENMVIGDGEGGVALDVSINATAKLCTNVWYSYEGRYTNMYCTEYEMHVFHDIQNNVSGWENMALFEKQSYIPKISDINCFSLADHETGTRYYEAYNPAQCYVVNESIQSYEIIESIETGAFAGYKLKLTNLENVKYLGWYAFQHTTLNDESRHITIKANQTAGEGVFAWSNVNAVTIGGDEVFPSMFRNCSDLTVVNIDFGNVTTIGYGAFMNTSLGERLDLSMTNIKNVLGYAFKNSGISKLNLGGVEKLGYEAFANNNIADLDFPKTIRYLTDGNVFLGNPLENITVRFDTYQHNIPYAFASILGCSSYEDPYCKGLNVKKLEIIAPYTSDESVIETHGEPIECYYKRYSWSDYSEKCRNETFSDEYVTDLFNPRNYKNIISGDFFNGFESIEELIIGDGYEYIGDGAFYSYAHGWKAHNELKRIVFPDSLRGIGRYAFAKLISNNGDPDEEQRWFTSAEGWYWLSHPHPDVQLPSGLIYIGWGAFMYNTALHSDFDMPDLEYIGDSAFHNTNLENIYLHNKLVYIGQNAFYYYTGDSGYNDDEHVWEGKRNITFDSDLAVDTDMGMYYYPQLVRFGTITFTENVHHLPVNQSGCNYNPHYYDPSQGNDLEYLVNSEYCYGKFGEKRSTVYHNASIDKFDMSASNITVIPGGFFIGAFIGEVLLPQTLETIGVAAFYATTITEELVLPEGLKYIGGSAFNSAYFANGYTGSYIEDEPFPTKALGVKITKLPKSIIEIGAAAFYGDLNLTADVDLPNLTMFRRSAFRGTGITSLHWYAGTTADVETLPGTYASESIPFDGNAMLKNVIIDADLAGVDIYAMIGGLDGYGYYSNNGIWGSNSGNHHLESLIINSSSIPAYYCGQIGREEYCTAYFHGLDADFVDLSGAGFDELPANAFNGATIGELKLPEGLTIIPSSAFYDAEIGGELKIPDTVKTLSNSFIKAKLDTVIMPTSMETTGYQATFWDAEVSNKIIIPDGTKIIPDNIFNGVRTQKIEIPQSIEKVGGSAFFKNDFLSMDLDLPNLKYIGNAAFMYTAIRDVVLHESVTTLLSGAFEYIPSLRNITIDCDFYQATSGNNFYGIFSTVPRDHDYRNHSQIEDKSTFNNVVFTDKNATTPSAAAQFAFFTINSLDISNVKWDTIPNGMFYKTTIIEPFTLPSELKFIERSAFQEAKMELTNTFAEGLERIGEGAFYATQVTGDINIPSTVTTIGWSAFNAGDADVHFNTVTIKPALDYEKTTNQAIFQMFWNAKMDKLVIESPMLPVLGTLQDTPILPANISVDGESVSPLRADGEPEFHGMTMREVEIKNLPVITANAFEECGNLEKVSFIDSLESIERYAFNNDTKLKTFVFGNGLEGKDVALHEYAFNNTAVENMVTGDDSDFNFAAANFHTIDERVFSNMPKLKTVDIPNNFNIDSNLVNEERALNGSHITAFTFADDPELSEVTIGYQVSEIRDGAFLNDEKLAKLFVWGNTEIQESNQLIQDFNNTTIPKGTNIFAYSDAPAEQYANAESRDNYDGKFYALDEVLYLTTNKTYVVLEQDEKGNNVDFNKDGLKLYALRRDGVILQSDNWQEYTTAYSRNNVPAEEGIITFEEGRGALGSDEADIAGIVYDAPKPFNTISLANQNYANVNFAFIQMPSSNNPLVLINYPDGYTGNIRTATLASMTKAEEEEYLRRLEEELEVPNTGVFLEVMKVATPSFSLSAIVVTGALLIAKKRR